MEYLEGQKIISNQRGSHDFVNALLTENVHKIMIVSHTTLEKTYLMDMFEQMPFEFVRFSQFSSNPDYDEVYQGVQLFLQEKCDALIAVGGGSTLDTAKCIKLFAKLDSSKPYLEQELVESSIPLVAIPTSAGSGSEANCQAVLYVNHKKHSVFHESALPNYIYFEPLFLDTLPDYALKSSLADAIAQCIESIWAKNATQESIEYASKGLHLLLDNMMLHLRKEKTAYKDIQMGAFYSGKAIGISKTTAAHVLSYNLSSMCHLSHGHAVFMLLPSVCNHLTKLLNETYQILDLQQIDNINDKEILELVNRLQIIKDIILPGNDYINLKNQLLFIYRVLGLPIPNFIGEKKIWELVENVNVERLSNHPIKLNKNDIYSIYIDSFRMIKDENGALIQDPEYSAVIERQRFVNGLQKLTLETLLLTQQFLDENNLTFYLGEGTLLGCIRHQGFIPWDDDVDICMPRDDYDRLVQLAKEGKVPETLNFDALENNDKHWVLGAKMQLVRETEYIQEKVIPLSKCCGPYVDIFPLDYWPKPYGYKQRLCDLKVKLSRRMLFMKTGYSKATKKKFHRIVLRIICLFVSNRQIEKMAIRNMKKFQNNNRKYYVNLCSYYPFYKEVFPASCFSKPVMKLFEGHMMPVPKEYDYVLKTIYGAKYDTIPPYSVTDMRKHAFALKNDNNSNS